MQPSPRILFRTARVDDIDTITTFSAAMALETEGRRLDLERLRLGTLSLLNSPAYGCFHVAEITDTTPPKVIGQMMITYEWSDWRNGAFWWIQSVYVDPAWRRQGVFRRMHDAIVAEAKARPDVCGVRLYVEEANHVAQAAYRRVGLTPCTYAVYEKDFLYPRRVPLKDRPDEA